jgi:hypothetical protein
MRVIGNQSSPSPRELLIFTPELPNLPGFQNLAGFGDMLKKNAAQTSCIFLCLYFD